MICCGWFRKKRLLSKYLIKKVVQSIPSDSMVKLGSQPMHRKKNHIRSDTKKGTGSKFLIYKLRAKNMYGKITEPKQIEYALDA